MVVNILVNIVQMKNVKRAMKRNTSRQNGATIHSN